MVEVEFFNPGDPKGDPTSLELTNTEALYFTPSTRKDFRQRLASLAEERNRLVFVATDQNRLVAFGVAAVRQVLSIEENGDIQLSRSHARHRLVDGRVSLQKEGWYRMAIDPASNAILRADPIEPLPGPPPPTSTFPPLDPCDLEPVSRSQANAFFSRVRLQPQIPFQYPANGCWARAHEMVRLIEHFFDPDPKEVVAKVWNRGKLVVRTDNNPLCFVNWAYHVAPVVKADGDLLVLDPALFEQAVSVPEWLGVQSDDPPRVPLLTSQHAYRLINFNTDLFLSENEELTESDLRVARGQLISQIYCSGPLPYRCREKYQ